MPGAYENGWEKFISCIKSKIPSILPIAEEGIMEP
jgi:hypothetical protein